MNYYSSCVLCWIAIIFHEGESVAGAAAVSRGAGSEKLSLSSLIEQHLKQLGKLGKQC